MKEEPKPGMADWIAKNLWAILAMALAGAQGYNVAMSTIAATSTDVENLKRTLGARRSFMNDSKDRLEYLCNRDKECAARFDPINVPE
ncbi:MAG: hypothetical protein ACRCYS_04190 [Beijerinckiaceae bacterium]